MARNDSHLLIFIPLCSPLSHRMGLTCITNRILQKWKRIISEATFFKKAWFLSHTFGSFTLGRRQLLCRKDTQGPKSYGEIHVVKNRCCRKGDSFQGPRVGSCLTLRNELSKETHVLTKQETLLGRGTWVESSRVREPRRTALPHGSQPQVLW